MMEEQRREWPGFWAEYLPGYEVWTVNLPGFPAWWELLILIAVVITIVALGEAIQRIWTSNNDSVPIPVALLICIGSFFFYLSVVGIFYRSTAPVHQSTIMIWGFICWIPALAFTSWTLLNSLSSRTVEHIGPFSARIEDPSEYSEARRLALRGDIEGAVQVYRSYEEAQPMALFEAGRLLKSQDHFAKAAILFEEIAGSYGNDTLIWAEATFQLAKVQSIGLQQNEAAQMNFRRVLERTPSSRFGQLAGQELARIQVMGNGFSESLARPAEKLEDPFYDDDDVRVVETMHSVSPLPAEVHARHQGEQPVPDADPFFLAREAFRAREREEEATRAKKKPVAKRKAVPRAKPETKKKASAKKRPVTRKKPAAKAKPKPRDK